MNSFIITNLLFIALSSATPTTNLAGAPPIVGGFLAAKKEFPFQVAIFFGGQHHCGGSIISEHFILTAAHCLVRDSSRLEVIVGVTNLNDRSAQRFKVAQQIGHEGYFDGQNLNDIALLRLEKPLIYSATVKPIELQTAEVPVNSILKIIGWGRTGNNLPGSQDLKYNVVAVQSNTECLGHRYNGLICLAHTAGNGACNGDSGGPAISPDGKVAGIANFVLGGCGTRLPDAYAKVSYFFGWINEKMNKYEQKKPKL